MDSKPEEISHSAPVAIRCRWPAPPRSIDPTEFFFGAWHPHADVRVEVDVPAGAHPVRGIKGRNWFLAGTELSIDGEVRALVHRGARANEGFAFRGYLLDRCVDGWCSADALRPLGQDAWPRRPNGVFAFARLAANGSRLELATDLLGVAPLYVRYDGELVLFSNSPRLLSTDADEADRVAMFARVNGISVPSSRSLNANVRRIDPGVVVVHARDGIESIPAPGLEIFPPSTVPIDDAAIDRLDHYWRQSVERCLALPGARRVVGLSSGHDSRRILGAMLSSGTRFDAITVRVLQKGARDLDARFASAMAAEFGFEHGIVELPAGAKAAAMDRDRRELLDAETGLHTWMLPLAADCGPGRVHFFDGLAGDVLGECGFMEEQLHIVDDAQAKQMLPRHLMDGAISSVLKPARWPDPTAVRTTLGEWVESLPAAQFRELAYLLSRTRRAVGLSSQLLLPAGCTAVYPFLDLDYAIFAMSLDTLSKLRRPTQRTCLERFEPRLAAFRGSRDVPTGLAPEPAAPERERRRSFLSALHEDLRNTDALGEFREGLAVRARTQVRLARFADSMLERSGWWFVPLAEVALCGSLRRPAWRYES